MILVKLLFFLDYFLVAALSQPYVRVIVLVLDEIDIADIHPYLLMDYILAQYDHHI